MTRRLLIFLLLSLALSAAAIERFPPPDFGPEYVMPYSSQAAPRAGWLAWLDTAALIVALSLAAAIALRWRSRRAMFWLSVASLAYLGFYRKGCVCPIGAIQNVAQALFDSSFVLPIVVVVFFALPLVFAILFGRVFCAGVCPIGALQDVVLLGAVKVPRPLDEGLSVIRYFYLGIAVLFAATGSAYVICEYDPMVSFFRMAGRFHIWIWSAGVLLLSTFVGRPYCRYLCPYGALLGLLSKFSFRRVTITPDKCIVCGLCRDACAFGAIREGNKKGEESA